MEELLGQGLENRMNSPYLIDRFPEPLSNEEAQVYFSHFVRFDKDGELLHKESSHHLEHEKVVLSLLFNYFSDYLAELKIFLEKTLSDYLKDKPWLKEALLCDEYDLYMKMSQSRKETVIEKPTVEELELLIKISCREVFFPKFKLDGISIEPHDDGVLVVFFDNELMSQHLISKSKEIGLYIRDI